MKRRPLDIAARDRLMNRVMLAQLAILIALFALGVALHGAPS